MAKLSAEGDPFSRIQSSVSDNCSNKTVRYGMFGLGMAPKEVLSRLFNPFDLKILGLYLEMWLWSPLICAKKVFRRGVDIWYYVKTYTFNNFVYFWYCLFYYYYYYYYYLYYYIAIFISLYISLLPLLLLLKLILSPFLPLLFSVIIY